MVGLIRGIVICIALAGCGRTESVARDAQTPEQAASMVERTHKFLQLCEANGGIAKYHAGKYEYYGKSRQWHGAQIMCKNGLVGYLEGAP